MAKKWLGQNFLKDSSVLADILNAGELTPNDAVLEIGPGEGFLTRALLEKAGHVTAVELDHDLIPWLKMDFGKNPKFTLIEGDALHFTPPVTPYKLIANIPYYITSPLLNHYLMEQFTSGHPPTLLVLMVQKEVAEKIVGLDGKQSVLSLQVQLFASAEIVGIVSRKSFRPIPKVDSAILKIRPHSSSIAKDLDLKKLFWLIHISFAQKRKKLSNNLAGPLGKNTTEIKSLLESIGLSPDIRAEDLKLEEWGLLYKEVELIKNS